MLALAILGYFYFTKAQPSALLPENKSVAKSDMPETLMFFARLRNKTIQSKIF